MLLCCSFVRVLGALHIQARLAFADQACAPQLACLPLVEPLCVPPCHSSVAEVTPDVGDVSAVVEELNETNDFSFFVRTMRKRFKLFVAAESS